MDKLKQAIRNRQRLRINYESRHSNEKKWREIDPLRIYFLQRALYLYARSHDKRLECKTFRISRIKDVTETGIKYAKKINDDEFYQKLANAFTHFMGKKTEEVVIKFTGNARSYLQECMWHHSQKIESMPDRSILFKVDVADPKEVLWWSLQFGEEAEIIRPIYLRDLARNTSNKMANLYAE